MYIRDKIYTNKEYKDNKEEIIKKYGKNNIYKTRDYKGRIIYSCYIFLTK